MAGLASACPFDAEEVAVLSYQAFIVPCGFCRGDSDLLCAMDQGIEAFL